MSKEMTMDKMGQPELQPVRAVEDVEAAANGQESSAGIAMESAPTAASGNAPSVLADNMNDSWSETCKEQDKSGNAVDVKYTYNRMQDFTPLLDRVNLQSGEVAPQKSLYRQDGESKDTVDAHNPSQGLYQTENYVTHDPVHMATESETPTFGQLAHIDPAGSPVNKIQGTLQMPNLFTMLEPTIFIDNTTYQEDVRQCNVGDCYFLAAVLQVIHYDPSKIVNMMSLVGDQVTTTLYHKETTGDKSTWKPTAITTKVGLLSRDHVSEKNENEQYYMGARVRVAYDPKRCAWVSSIDGTTLKIDKYRMYEAALWVNCLEQAFSIFAQKYGQYGDGENVTPNKERFKATENGFANLCLNMFFGDDAMTDNLYTFTDAPAENRDLLRNNRPILYELLSLSHSQDGTSDTDVYLSAVTPRLHAAKRLLTFNGIVQNDITKALESDPDNAGLKDALKTTQAIAESAEDYLSAETGKQLREGVTPPSQTKSRISLDDLSLALERNSAFQNLHLSSYETLQQSLGTVVSFKEDDENAKNGANIFIFTGHAYNIDHVCFVDKTENPFTPSNMNDLLENVDIKKSIVTMQNPHAQTTPAYHEAEDKSLQGRIDTPLDVFLNNIAYVTSARVKKH